MAKTAIEGRRSLQIYLASKDNHMSFKQQKTPKYIYILHHFTTLKAHKILIMLHVIFFVLGITEKQRETFVNTESKFHKGFTLGIQLGSQQGQDIIKGNH